MTQKSHYWSYIYSVYVLFYACMCMSIFVCVCVGVCVYHDNLKHPILWRRTGVGLYFSLSSRSSWLPSHSWPRMLTAFSFCSR